MKICKGCNEKKSLDNFYTYKSGKEQNIRTFNYCKSCKYITNRKWALDNPKRMKEFKDLYIKRNPENFKESQEKYRKNNMEKFREKCRNYYKENTEKMKKLKYDWMKDNMEATKAHHAVNSALKKGTLKKLPCIKCKSENVHAHHPDYSKPLEVIWVCPLHHKQIHKLL